MRVVLTARRGDRLEALAAELQAEIRRRHAHDRGGSGAAECVAADRRASWRRAKIAIDVLVNNAGYGVPGSYINVPWSDHERFMQVMVTAVLDLTYRLLPGMLDRGWGRIINIASVAGMVPCAGRAHAVRRVEVVPDPVLGSARRRERAEGRERDGGVPRIHVERISDVTGTRDRMNKMPGLLWLKADDVAREGYDAVMKGRSVVVNGAHLPVAGLADRRLAAQPVAVGVGRWRAAAIARREAEHPPPERPYHPPWLRRC